MIKALLHLLIDLFRNPRKTFGFLKIWFNHFYLKDQRRMTMGEHRAIAQRIKSLEKSGERPYELLFLEYWIEEYGYTKSKAKMTGKYNNKLRMKTQLIDGRGNIEQRLKVGGR